MPQSHIEGYIQHPRTDLVMLVDVMGTDYLRRVIKPWQALLRDGDIMLSNEISALSVAQPEIVSIATPEKTHVGVFRQVLKVCRPVAIFMEKPLAVTSAGCRSITEECERRGIVLAVNHSRAWDSDVRQMRPPATVEFGGRRWRNDVHAAHLSIMLGGGKMTQKEENGLWADGEPMWGHVRKNVMVKAITDILVAIETGKEPECDGRIGSRAVELTESFYSVSR